MTEEQLLVANNHKAAHEEAIGYRNLYFRKGYIEKLSEISQLPRSFDVIVSNCVVNLSPNKRKVFQEAYKVLKAGGEMYFSDVYSSQRINPSLRLDPVLAGNDKCVFRT